MTRKSQLALLAALASLSLGTVYAADYGNPATKGAGDTATPPSTQTPPSSTSPSDATSPGASPKRTMTKDEALSKGVTEEVFRKADTNGDGVLDENEINTYNSSLRNQQK
jgi:hypothetical protein